MCIYLLKLYIYICVCSTFLIFKIYINIFIYIYIQIILCHCNGIQTTHLQGVIYSQFEIQKDRIMEWIAIGCSRHFSFPMSRFQTRQWLSTRFYEFVLILPDPLSIVASGHNNLQASESENVKVHRNFLHEPSFDNYRISYIIISFEFIFP